MAGYGESSGAKAQKIEASKAAAFAHAPTVEAVRGGNLEFGVKQRKGDNQPEKRRNLILKQLLEVPVCESHGVEAPAQVSRPLEDAACVHRLHFLSFLAEGHSRWHAAGHDDTFCLDGSPDTFIPYHFLRTNAEEPPGKHVETQIAFYANDSTTYLFQDTHLVLEQDLAIVRASTNAIVNGRQVVYALTSMPGHHAAPFHYGGYCYINYAAIAAHQLQQQGYRVGILDVDYHGGDGTLHCTKANDQICKAFMSIHSGRDYPYMDFGEFGIEMAVKANWEQYSEALNQAIERIMEKDVTALVISLGLDTLGGDPDASDLAGCDLQVEDFRQMGAVFRGLKLPILFTQEGGYKLEAVASAVEQLLLGLMAA
jgi:acetoin utilization deacetylase AcuC-like enzyme